MDKIRDEIKAKMDENKKKREDDMNEFGSMFKQDKLDKDQLIELSKKHDANREEMKSFFLDELIKVHSILTPEQRTKAVEKMKEFKDKHDKHLPPGDKHPDNQKWDD
jgi:Spy/CpxP family protein refolding chaperone